MKKEEIISILQENLSAKEIDHLLLQLHQPVVDIEYNTLGFKQKRSFFDWLFRRRTNQVVVFSVLSLFEDFKINSEVLQGILGQIQQFSVVREN